MQQYSRLPLIKKKELFKVAIGLRKSLGIGARKINQIIKTKYNVLVPEVTVSNWIYYNRVPGRNQLTWFKPKPKPNKKTLERLYIDEGKSREEIAHIFKVTNVTIAKWLKIYKIPLRNKMQAMNTKRVKSVLRACRLIKPIKNFKRLTKEKAYILGVLCGDGYVSENFVQLEISNVDEEFMKEFIRCFKKVYGFRFNYHFRPKRNTLVTYISPEFICNDLLSYGVFGVRAWRVPEVIMRTNKKDITSSFLRGFFDSEGCVAKRFIVFGIVNKKGALGITKLLKKLGIKTSFKQYKKFFGYYYGNVYTVSIYGRENIEKFKKLISFTIFRKKEKLENLYK